MKIVCTESAKYNSNVQLFLSALTRISYRLNRANVPGYLNNLSMKMAPNVQQNK